MLAQILQIFHCISYQLPIHMYVDNREAVTLLNAYWKPQMVSEKITSLSGIPQYVRGHLCLQEESSFAILQKNDVDFNLFIVQRTEQMSLNIMTCIWGTQKEAHSESLQKLFMWYDEWFIDTLTHDEHTY